MGRQHVVTFVHAPEEAACVYKGTFIGVAGHDEHFQRVWVWRNCIVRHIPLSIKRSDGSKEMEI